VRGCERVVRPRPGRPPGQRAGTSRSGG
jgi:hypothetical protein